MNNNIKCDYVSGASIVFSNKENNSAFIVSVLPTGDQYQKKEIVAIVDNEKLTNGLFKRDITKPQDVLLKFKQWGANPDNINKMSDFLSANLEKKEKPKKSETYFGGGISKEKIEGNYSSKKEF